MLNYIMGIDYFSCNYCQECKCEFHHCIVCEEDSICCDCVDSKWTADHVYNVISHNDKKIFICDDCLILSKKELDDLNELDQSIKDIILSFDLSYVVQKYKEERIRLQKQLSNLSHKYSKVIDEIYRREN